MQPFLILSSLVLTVYQVIGYINQFKQYGTVFNFPRFLIILRTHFPYFEAIYNDEIHPLAKKKKKMVTVIALLNDFIIHFKNSDYHKKNKKTHHDEGQSLKYNAFKSFFFFHLTNIVISITISLLF